MLSDKGALDTYWRFGDYKHTSADVLKERLEEAGYHVTKAESKKKVVEKMHRIERGLICYNNCSLHELKSFIQNRRLGNVGDSEQHLAQRLMAADRLARFSRFCDLPPELRVRVYSYYCNDLPRDIYTPAQPPISKVSRLLRQESLPIFYQTCSLRVEFTRLRQYDPEGVAITSTVRPSQDTTCFLNTIAPKNAAETRNIIVELAIERSTQVECRLRLSNSSTGHHCEVISTAKTSPSRGASTNRAEKSINALMDSVAVSEGKKRLSVDDIYGVRRVLMGVYADA